MATDDEREDWVIRRGDLYLIAPYWVIWEEKPSDGMKCRFTHARALAWCASYNAPGNGNGLDIDGPPEAVAIYEPERDE
jgi:hypothetical protein